MSIAIQLTVEGETVEETMDRLKAVASLIYHHSNIVYNVNQAAHDGKAHPILIGDVQVGCVSIEDDEQMNGRMRLRRVGQAQPAFQRERQQYDFEQNAEREGPRTEVTESWDTGRGE